MSWFDFKATTTYRDDKTLKVVIKSVFIKMRKAEPQSGEELYPLNASVALI